MTLPKINLNSKEDIQFVDYVWSFYGTDDPVYPISGLTKGMIVVGTYIYRQYCLDDSKPEMQWSDGDSLDREHVRDIILDIFNLKWGNE